MHCAHWHLFLHLCLKLNSALSLWISSTDITQINEKYTYMLMLYIAVWYCFWHLFLLTDVRVLSGSKGRGRFGAVVCASSAGTHWIPTMIYLYLIFGETVDSSLSVKYRSSLFVLQIAQMDRHLFSSYFLPPCLSLFLSHHSQPVSNPSWNSPLLQERAATESQ